MTTDRPPAGARREPGAAHRERTQAWWRSPDARVAAMTAGLAATTLAAQFAWLAAGAPPTGQGVVYLVVVAALFALVEKFVFFFPVRRGSHTISFSEIPLVLGLVMIHPVLLVVVRLVGGLVGLTVFRRQRGSKLTFNLALYATQVSVAAAVFHLVVRSADPLSPLGWAATFAATFVADLVSLFLVTTAISLHDDSEEWRRLVTADIKSLFQLPLVAVTTTLALVTALVVREQVEASVLLAILAFVLSRVFQGYARQTQGHAQVEELYDFARALDGSRDTDEVTRTVLIRVRDLVRAESAELRVAGGPDRAPVRIRLSGQEHTDVSTDDEPVGQTWWQPASEGAPILLATSKSRLAVSNIPADAMAVPVALNDATGVLIVTGTLPDIPTFTPEHLRLLQALAAHAGVALSKTQLVDQLRHIGLHDPLTDLPNRRLFLADVHRAVDALPATKTGITGTTGITGITGIMLLDLDRFKEINDALGHAVGNDLLREIGRRLQRTFSGRGTVARLGGDEFAIVVTHAASTLEILDAAGELRRTVEQPVPVGDLTLTVQASIGVCFAPDHGLDADYLLQRADIAMYVAKQARTGIRVYQPGDDQNTPRRLALVTDLRAAIEGRTLEVVYQPQVDPGSGRVIGAEALARWSHRDGPVSPDEFIPLAERSGLIGPLTRHVLDTALAACAAWRQAGQPISVSVNLSPHVLADQTLTDDVRQALLLHAVLPPDLTLEITENGIMNDPHHSHLTLSALHELGVKLSIDDFGTGHSSLGRLAELPIHEMKIDKSFVRHLMTKPSRRAVTDASLQLGHALDLVVVAEGVEDRAEYEYLRQQGCDAIQGYYVAKPLPAPVFMNWLLERANNTTTLRDAKRVG